MTLDIEGVLAAHVPLGDDAEGIEQCSCGVLAIWRRDVLENDVRYLPSHAEGPDLRWHAAHVAAVLREQIAEWIAGMPWTETARDDLLAQVASSRVGGDS